MDKLKDYLKSKILENDEVIIENFKLTKWKFFKIYTELLGYISAFLYKHKDGVYIFLLIIGVFTIYLKFLNRNLNLFIDNLNILNILNYSLVFILFLVMILILIMGVWILVDIIALFLYIIILKKIIKNENLKFNYIQLHKVYLRIICCITIVIVGFLLYFYTNMTSRANMVEVKLTNSDKVLNGDLLYFSNENYIIEYIENNIKKLKSIPKANVEYLKYSNFNK